MTGLRFAPLVRVSTEKQEKRGESLNTQRKQLEQAIKSLKGTVYKWYQGQEHATPDNERKILDELMRDAQAGKFDAVMVVDISRWSRDNGKSKQYLKILKDNNIHFYVNGRHMDLNVPFQNLIIGMGTEINEFFASEQAYKSLTNKIELAKKNVPCSGQIPYGRTFNKETKTWGIDREKQKVLIDAANRYLKGESLKNIAEFYKMNLPNLHKLLKERAGDSYDIHFFSEDFGIDETVTLKMPRLLSEEIIEKIKKKSKANLTFTHGFAKYKYLLGRMIFCEECGLSLHGQANRNGTLYYRHSRVNNCKHPFNVPAPIIEEKVIGDLFRMFGDKPRIEAAAKAAITNLAEVEKLELTIAQANKELANIERAKDKIIDMIEAGNISGDDVKKRMTALKETESGILIKLDEDKKKIENTPSQADIKLKSALILRLSNDILKSKGHLEEMSWDDKRKLLQSVFDGKDKEGKRLGVYLSKNDKGDKIYTINGLMGITLTDYMKGLTVDPSNYLIEDDYLPDDETQKDTKKKGAKHNLLGIHAAYDCGHYH